MAVTNNLYPGIIDSYMPAFLIRDNSSNIKEVTKTYTTVSYLDQQIYDAAVDQYINNSTIDGVQELWDEYEIELAEIRAAHPDPRDPERVALEQALKVLYDGRLKELISGTADEKKIEETFFAENPGPTITSHTATFNTTTTTNEKYICRVYFALSNYNSKEEIANVQVTVRSQLNNNSALHPDKYPSEIMLKKLKLDPNKQGNDRYYIDIKPEDMRDCNFDIDQYYKVQIRFTSIYAEDPGIDLDDPDAVQAIDTWLSRNLNQFSEWSTVCLIRGISEPTVQLQGFGEGIVSTIYDTVVNTKIIGELIFADPNETETLKSYNIKAYDDNDNLLLESEEQYSSNFTEVNHFNYIIKYWFQAGNNYRLVLTYTTKNLYTESVEFPIAVTPSPLPNLNLQVVAYKDDENGRIGMRVNRSRAKGKYTGKLIIRRASSKDDFAIWEDMYIVGYDNAAYIDFTWWDYTIESGVFYLYGIQGEDTKGDRTPMSKFNKPVMCVFDHVFLTGEDKQLKIAFNPSISSFKRVVSEAKIDTIGSQYPFIKRNGYVDYAQFPLGGLIASAMDEDGIFATKEKTYNNNTNFYADYNEENEVSDYSDIVWEKFFRDKVSKFLYDDKVRLFRSPTEGNFLVRIMDVNFQPNQTLGRRLWSFTSNLYEIDDCSVENYDKYNIITIEDNTNIVSSGGDEPSTLAPIKRIIFVNSQDEFPVIGKANVLYIYNRNLYIWNEEDKNYIIISTPLWNDDSPDLIGLTGKANQLYTDGKDLYTWNKLSENYEKISVSVMEG